jgi:UDP-glucose 4-epimerase
MTEYDRILVTGGAGFIGSHIVDSLLEQDRQVWVVDNLLTGSQSNLRRWIRSPRLHFERSNITRYIPVERLVEKVEAVIHLAAVVSPALSIRYPELTRRVNVAGTLNLLKASARNHVQGFIFASSCAVYGETDGSPILENSRLVPISPYAVSKFEGEKQCETYCKSEGLPTTILRFFNVYGDRQGKSPYSGVIPVFARRLREGRRPVIYGDGNQTRDFVHVSDVVTGTLLALQTCEAVGEVFNIGTGRSTSIGSLLAMLCEATSSDIQPIFGKERKGDIRHSCANVEKARLLLGFRSKVTLKDGLRLLVKTGFSALID